MRIQFDQPIPVTFMGNTIYLAPEDFETAQHFRREGMDDFESNSLRWIDGVAMRAGYYTIQFPKELEPGGELCPTFVEAHVSDDDLRRMGLDRNTLRDVWRSPETGEKLADYLA